MDSHDDSQNATPSNSSTYKVKTLKMIAAASLKTRFYENYCRRRPFSLPDSIMHYITKNPKTPEIYHKMVQCCKYFFVKNPTLIIHHLNYGYDIGKGKWKTLVERNSFTLDLNNIGCKLWITQSVDTFFVSSATVMQNLVSSIVPKIYRCDAEYLDIDSQVISYQDYCFLSTFSEMIEFHNVTITNADDSITPFEKLIEAAPKLENATFTSDTILTNITPNTVEELIKLSNFSQLHELRLNSIPETFDLDAFYIYMKANKFTNFDLKFDDTISDGYKSRLEKIIDDIIEAEKKDEIDFKPPYIEFDGIDEEKNEMLYYINCPY